MIAEFLRPPRGAAEIAADALRILGLVGVLVAALLFSATDAGILAFVLPGLLLPRFLGMRAGFDIAYCLALQAAGWSNVLDLYTRVTWWDIPVHLVCTGMIAIVAYLFLARLGAVARPGGAGFTVAGGILVTTALGLAVSALWEMVEWIGKTYVSSAIFVEYDDTIGDMAVGGLGALLAGVLLATVRLERVGAFERVDAGGSAEPVRPV
ncbi:hypothetical protein [Herbiconiux solani]|uniref:hypothetical protein n=1 Tax=Herbiconiux solani TaxID=661329 RepID=UPI000826B524|nr:hypothetical protein [Herbiconiux solani]